MHNFQKIINERKMFVLMFSKTPSKIKFQEYRTDVLPLPSVGRNVKYIIIVKFFVYSVFSTDIWKLIRILTTFAYII
jgi:hypothetical protein